MPSDRPKPRTMDLPAAVDDHAQAAMYRIMVENTIDIIVRYNAARERTYISPASREMLGYEPEEMMDSSAAETMHPDDFARVNPRYLKFGPNEPNLEIEFRMRRKDGSYVWVQTRHRYVPEDGTSVAVMRDITVRKNAELLLEEANQTLQAANDVLRQLAQQDGLTGLANRRRFDELLDQEFRRAVREHGPVAILLLDVDSFKAYNDRYGHLAGDNCLRRIARTIEVELQRPSDHAARYGGEEFVALLPATDLTGAMAVAERVREAVEALAIEHLGNAHRMVTLSIGVSAILPYDGDDPVTLIEAADRALYRAKSDGRNRVLSSAAGAPVTAD